MHQTVDAPDCMYVKLVFVWYKLNLSMLLFPFRRTPSFGGFVEVGLDWSWMLSTDLHTRPSSSASTRGFPRLWKRISWGRREDFEEARISLNLKRMSNGSQDKSFLLEERGAFM